MKPERAHGMQVIISSRRQHGNSKWGSYKVYWPVPCRSKCAANCIIQSLPRLAPTFYLALFGYFVHSRRTDRIRMSPNDDIYHRLLFLLFSWYSATCMSMAPDLPYFTLPSCPLMHVAPCVWLIPSPIKIHAVHSCS